LQYDRGCAEKPFGRTHLVDMATIRERKKRGEEIVKKYKPSNLNDPYACAVDAIADILLYVAENQAEGRRIMHSAEIDFRNAAEGEAFLTEG
jgi:hypothetical protein